MSEVLRTAYFPGCTLKTDARAFETSALAVAKALGIEVIELSRWNCCGTVYSLDAVNLMPRMASVHNLIRVEEEGFSEVMTLCSMCYNTLQQTNTLLTRKSNHLAAINDFLYLEPNYNGQVRVRHFLQMLRDQIEPGQIQDLVINPLSDLALAPYYGCLLLRPTEVAIDHPENPEILTPLLAALGARVVNFPLKNECCGAYQTTIHREAVVRRAYRILNSAQAEGADVITVSCPLCHYNLSTLRDTLGATYPGLKRVAILYFTELMARAMGLHYRTETEENRQVLAEAAR